jgi:hypothetical protein
MATTSPTQRLAVRSPDPSVESQRSAHHVLKFTPSKGEAKQPAAG